jgi:hypothetical protein
VRGLIAFTGRAGNRVSGRRTINVLITDADTGTMVCSTNIIQQPVGQLTWSTNLVRLTKLKDPKTRLAYPASALEHGWSRAMLAHHIEQGTVERTGKATTNFERTLPKPLSDLARESLKDPYKDGFERSHQRGAKRYCSRTLATGGLYVRLALTTMIVAVVTRGPTQRATTSTSMA